MQILVSALLPITAQGGPSTSVISHTKHSSDSTRLSFVMLILIGLDVSEEFCRFTKKLVVKTPALKSVAVGVRANKSEKKLLVESLHSYICRISKHNNNYRISHKSHLSNRTTIFQSMLSYWSIPDTDPTLELGPPHN